MGKKHRNKLYLHFMEPNEAPLIKRIAKLSEDGDSPWGAKEVEAYAEPLENKILVMQDGDSNVVGYFAYRRLNDATVKLERVEISRRFTDVDFKLSIHEPDRMIEDEIQFKGQPRSATYHGMIQMLTYLGDETRVDISAVKDNKEILRMAKDMPQLIIGPAEQEKQAEAQEAPPQIVTRSLPGRYASHRDDRSYDKPSPPMPPATKDEPLHKRMKKAIDKLTIASGKEWTVVRCDDKGMFQKYDKKMQQTYPLIAEELYYVPTSDLKDAKEALEALRDALRDSFASPSQKYGPYVPVSRTEAILSTELGDLRKHFRVDDKLWSAQRLEQEIPESRFR